MRGLHRVVAVWVTDHKHAQAKRQAEIRASRRDEGWKPHPIPDLTEAVGYRFRVTSTLMKGLEAAGGKVLDGKVRDQLTVECSGEQIEISVIQKMRQWRGRPSEETPDWIAFRELHNAGLQPSGFQRFTVTTYFGGGLKKEWIETDKNRAESLLPSIIAGLLAIGPALVELQRECEERHRQYELDRQREAEQRRLAQLEQDRWERFRKLAIDWEEAQRLRAFLAALEQLDDGLREEIDGLPRSEWLEWARQRVNKLDPTGSE